MLFRSNYSVGVDHCDLAALKERGIVVTNTPDVLSDATAEIAILLLLGASRRAYEGDQMLRLGTWKHWAPVGMNGIQVSSKKLGIVGMGRVGQTVAKRARGFDMEIHYTNRRRLPAELEQGAIYHPTIKSLFEAVDMISLNCPATPETENLINVESIGWMKPGVVFVNTARGRLVDENALIDALHSGHIAAAGLDVFQTEPGGNPAFAACPNVFMLPHLGSSTRETDVVLDVSLQVAQLLQAKGVEVLMTRTSEVDVDLPPRVALANNSRADLFLSIHANALSLSRPDVNGIETFYFQGGASQRLAQAVQSQMLTVSPGSPDRGARPGRFFVIRRTVMPAALAEMGFVTGELDSPRLADPGFRRRMALAIAAGLLNYLNSP